MNYILKKEVKSTSYFYYFFRFIKSFDDTITNNPSNETSNGESNSNGLSNNERSQKVKHWAQYRKDKKRLHKGKLLSVKENLRLFERPPEKSSTY
ncbi:17757_t:CDS:2 [Rhizophagus irregularis]|nr:17757_t:CDS:2 [Rhizophagus irregularis]